MSQINFKKVNEELFDQLERLGNENLSGDAMKMELARSKALCFRTEITQMICQNGLLLQKLRDEAPMLLSRHPDIEEWFHSQRIGLEGLLRTLEQSGVLPAA